MNKDLLNILSNSNKDINNQKLMDYISGHLSAEEAHEVEQMMADNNFTNDAIEGLQNIKSGKQQLETLTEQLNRDLQKKLAEKKRRKEKRKLKEEPWILFAVALILVLIVVAYLFIKKFPGL